MPVCNIENNKNTLKVKKQFDSMQNPDHLQQVFLSEAKQRICIYTHTHKYPCVHIQNPVAVPCHTSKAQDENWSKKHECWNIFLHIFLLHIPSYKYEKS